MESLKSPAMVVSSIALVASLGSAGYFYKRIEGVAEELDKFSDVVEKMASRMKSEDEVKAQIESVGSHLREFSKTLKGMEDIVGDQDKKMKEIENIYKAILEALDGADIEVQLKKKKGGKKKAPPTKSDDESDEDSDDDYLRQIKSQKKR